MDGQYYDLVAMGTTLEDFSKISKQTTSSTLNTIENGYIGQNSSDPLIGKMGSSVIGEIEQIEQSNENIINYWNSYNNDVAAVDKTLASDDKNTGAINSEATSNYIKSNLLDKLGFVDTSKIPEFNLGKTLTTLGQGISNMLTGNNSGTVANKSNTDADSSNNPLTNLINSLGSLNMAGQLIDPNVFKNLSVGDFSKIGELFTTFMTVTDENLPAATTALTDFLQTTGIFSQKAATQLNEIVNAYVSEGVNATLEGAAAFSSNFDYQTVGTDYIGATKVLAEEGVKGAQAGLKTGFSNFDFGPIIASGVAGVGTMAAGIATNPTNLGSYLNPIVDVAAATLNQTIPALSAGATAFVGNFNTGRVVDGYVRATINAAKITAEAARIGVKEGISAVNVSKLSSVTGQTLNNIGLACGEAYAQLMDTFNNFANSVNLPELPGLPGFNPGGSSGSGSGSGSGIGNIDWSSIWQNPNLNIGELMDKIGLPRFDLSVSKDAINSIDSMIDNIPGMSMLDNISLADLPGSGFNNVGEYREALKNSMIIDNANFVTLLPEFLFAARNTLQMAAYAPQITYDKGAEQLNLGFNKLLDAKNGMLGYNPISAVFGTSAGTKSQDDIKVITSIGDSCQSGWGLEDYNARGKYVVANENVAGSAPQLVGQAVGAEVNQLHMPGARTTEVLQILNPLSTGMINKASVPFPSDLLGIFDPNHATSLTNSPAQVLTPLLYGFGDHYTDPVMGAMTPQYTSDALVSYREKYIKSIQESDVIVLDIGMNDYWVPFAGAFYEIARDGGAGTDDLMKDMNDDPLGWMAKFCVNLVTAFATHPDKWLQYGAMILETPFKWAFDYYINYALICGLIYFYNPDAELVLVGGYNPCEGWDLIPGMDDNLISYVLQAFENVHDLWKKGICLFYPGKIKYADMRGVEIQSDETTMVLPSLDSDMYNPHPTQKGAYQQADKILTALGADSPYKEEIKGDAGYYDGEEEFFETMSIHVPRRYLEGIGQTVAGDFGKGVAGVANTPLDVVPHSVKDIANLAGVNVNK